KFQDVCQDRVTWNVPGIPLEYLQDHFGLWAVAVVGRPETGCTRKDPAIPLAPQQGDMDGPETESGPQYYKELWMRRIGRRTPHEVTNGTLKPEAVHLAKIDLKEHTMRQRQKRVYGGHGVRHPSEIVRQLDTRLRGMSPGQQKAEHEELVSKLLMGALVKKVKQGARPVHRRKVPILRAPVKDQHSDRYVAPKAPRGSREQGWISLVEPVGG